jgi:hypothetical protein
MLRVVVVANKWFEADPLMSVLTNPAARPQGLPVLENILWPRAQQTSLGAILERPRATLFLDGERSILVEIWCLQDLMNPFLSYSNTAEKARVLSTIATYGKAVDFVVAFGTAGYALEGENLNGSTVLGSNVFVHNPYKTPNPASNWSASSGMETVVVSTKGAGFLAALETNSAVAAAADTRMIPELRMPAAKLALSIRPDGTAVSEVNVVDYNDYGKFDQESVDLATAAGAMPASIETTHGVIRLVLGDPFIFVSAITDRFGMFNSDVTIPADTAYPQNFVASHNAGLTVAWMLPALGQFLLQDAKPAGE